MRFHSKTQTFYSLLSIQITINMLLSEHFVVILAHANKTFPKVAGQIFTYNTKKKIFEVNNKDKATKGFQMRSIFLFSNAAAILLRIISTYFQANDESSQSKMKTEMNLCMMMLYGCIVPAERYRVRGYFPENFVTFFNQVIQVETRQNQGII